ncbi:hypothetical protein D3C87_1511070 [compost metagenome]
MALMPLEFRCILVGKHNNDLGYVPHYQCTKFIEAGGFQCGCRTMRDRFDHELQGLFQRIGHGPVTVRCYVDYAPSGATAWEVHATFTNVGTVCLTEIVLNRLDERQNSLCPNPGHWIVIAVDFLLDYPQECPLVR